MDHVSLKWAPCDYGPLKLATYQPDDTNIDSITPGGREPTKTVTK